jgi:hypothetical protein
MIAPARASVDGAILDPAGDANGSGLYDALTNTPLTTAAPSLPPAGYSYGPADLREVWLTTDYVTESDENGVPQNRATGITVHVKTEEAFDPSGFGVLYNVELPLGPSCDTEVTVELGGGSAISLDEDQTWWQWDNTCEPGGVQDADPTTLDQTTYYNAGWVVQTSGKELTFSAPFDTLQSWQRDLLVPGTSIAGISASTQIELFFYPDGDGTRPTGHFTVGADVPTV